MRGGGAYMRGGGVERFLGLGVVERESGQKWGCRRRRRRKI